MLRGEQSGWGGEKIFTVWFSRVWELVIHFWKLKACCLHVTSGNT